MLKFYISLLLSLSVFANIFGQITISRLDMPFPNDTIYMGTQNFYFGTGFTAAGPNQSWDFSALQSATTRLDTFVSIASTPFAYQLFFNNPLPPYNENRSNVAMKLNDSTLPQLGPIQFSNVYGYFKNPNTPAIPIINPNPPRLYAQTGFGAQLSLLPLSVPYKPAKDMDILYEFPLQYLDSNNCESEWELSVPNIGFISETRIRENKVDAWGSVITPIGTFNVLRVKSYNIISDSIKIADSLLPIPIPGIRITRYETEYKWIANGRKLPLVKAVYTSLVAGTQGVLSSIEFQKFNPPPINPTLIQNISVNALRFYYSTEEQKLYITNFSNEKLTVNLYSLEGKIFKRITVDNGSTSIELSKGYSSNLILAKVTSMNGNAVYKIPVIR